MAKFDANNYKKEFTDVPSDVANIGEYGGRVKTMYDEFAATVANGDDVYYGKIPAGARILRLTLISGGGTAPVFNKNDTGGISAIAVGDKLTEEADAVLTVDAGDGGGTAGKVFCEYLLD